MHPLLLHWIWLVLLLASTAAVVGLDKTSCHQKSNNKKAKVPKRLMSSERNPSCLVVNRCSDNDRGLAQTKLPNLIPLLDIQTNNEGVISDTSKGKRTYMPEIKSLLV